MEVMANRRQVHRIGLRLPLQISGVLPSGERFYLFTETSNVSSAGAYFHSLDNVESGMDINVLIGVPCDVARTFPFVKITGSAVVVRVEDLTEPGADRIGKKGVAIRFSSLNVEAC